MIYDLIMLTTIIVYILDISGVSNDIKSFISKILTKGKIQTVDYELKPWLCSKCMSFWCGLVYLLVCDKFCLSSVCLVCMCSYMTMPIKDFLLLIKDLFTKVINILQDKLC